MRWPATERFVLRAAPGGVGLIQDFLMTGDPEGRLGEPDLLATLDDALQWLAVARAMSSITDRTITYDAVSTQTRRDQLQNAGLAEWRVDLLLGIDELNRHSVYGVPNDSVRELTGHPARNIEDFLRRHQAVLTPPPKDEHAG